MTVATCIWIGNLGCFGYFQRSGPEASTCYSLYSPCSAHCLFEATVTWPTDHLSFATDLPYPLACAALGLTEEVCVGEELLTLPQASKKKHSDAGPFVRIFSLGALWGPLQIEIGQHIFRQTILIVLSVAVVVEIYPTFVAASYFWFRSIGDYDGKFHYNL